MSTRHLDAMFSPVVVAVIGASLTPGRTGTTVWRNLCHGGFSGTLLPVNLKSDKLNGVHVYAHVRDLPVAPDLAVICTPTHTVAALVAELGARGTRAVLVMTPAMSDAQRQSMLNAARVHTLRLLGPDSLGLLLPHSGLHAGLTHVNAQAGDLAFVSQSAGLITPMLDWASAQGVGFSHVVSLGACADVDVADMLDFLGSDPRCRAIMLYLDHIGSARKFMSAARSAARNKPVLVVKAKEHLSHPGRRGVASHLSEVVGDPNAVWEAALARAGVLRVATLNDLFLAAGLLTRWRHAPAKHLVVMSNSGAVGHLAADAAQAAGVPLAELDGAVLASLKILCPPQAGVLQTHPVDLADDAPVTRYVQVLQAILAQPDVVVLLIHAPTVYASSTDIAHALLPVVAAAPHRVLACWLGASSVVQARQLCRQAGVPDFDSPEEAVRAVAMLQSYRQHQQALIQTPPARLAETADLPRLRHLVQAVLDSGREQLSDAESALFLQAAGVPVTPGDPESAMTATPSFRVSACVDALFGPVLRLQLSEAPEGGGAWALPPLNTPLALALMARAAGVFGRGRAVEEHAQAALSQVLVTVSHVLAEVPELAELEISVDADGVQALAARVRLSALCPSGAAKFAIQPYPQHLIEVLRWRGEALDVRPIRPEDETQHLDFLRQMSPEDIRMRVFYSRRRIEHTELARLTQIDYAREMAFIATRSHPERGEETLGVVRATTDADNDTAEFGVLIRSDLKGQGLGRLLMQKMLAYLRERGTRQLVATVLRVNQGMRQLAQSLGFQEVDFPPGHQATQEADVCFMVLPLQSTAPPGARPFSSPELHPSQSSHLSSQPPSHPL